MITLVCPHCEESIELLGPSNLAKEYGLDNQRVIYWRKHKTHPFPKPAVQLPRGYVYFKHEVDKWEEDKAREDFKPLIERMGKTLEQLPPEMRAEALKELASGSRLDGNDSPKRRKRGAPKKGSASRQKKGGLGGA